MYIKRHFIMLWAISQMDLYYSLTLLTEVEPRFRGIAFTVISHHI